MANTNIKLLNENGYPSKGVEISSISSRIANEIIGVEVANTELKDFSYQEKFEGVMLMDVLERIDEQVKGNPIVIYMKGTPQFPQCGFSSRAAAALQDCGEKFAYVNVLADPEIFENLPRYADWPTFPQLYIDGELQGGCDITLELAESGELKNLMAAANAKVAE